MTNPSQTLVRYSDCLRKLLRLVYYLLYHSFSWSYDLAAAFVSAGHWNDWIRETIPLVSGPKILELGFGPGHLQVDLIQRGFQVIGLDESSQMIRQAAGRIRSKHLPANLVRGLTQQLPYQMHFDCIIATFPSDYIFSPDTIKEIYRVLVPGGKLIILLTAMPSRDNIFAKLYKWVSIDIFQGKSNPMEKRLEQVIQYFRREGFRIEKTILERKIVSLLLLIGDKPLENF